MLSNIIPITERDMLLSWGLAEAGNRMKPILNPDLIGKVSAGSILKDSEVDQLVSAAVQVRGVMHDFFRVNETHWFMVDFPTEDFGAVRVVNYFRRFSPNRNMAELATLRPDIGNFVYDPPTTTTSPR